MEYVNNLLINLKVPLIFAYIDAGTGSMIIQIIIGSLAGGLLALKLFWSRLKGWFKRDNHSEEKLKKVPEHPN